MAENIQEMKKAEARVPERGERTKERRVYSPAADIVERKDDIIIVADMPGVDENSLDIVLEKNVLTINGRVEAYVPEHHRLALSEYGVGDYHRVFTLTDEIDREKIQASVKNGVLKLTLPKAEAVKSRKIAVKAEA